MQIVVEKATNTDFNDIFKVLNRSKQKLMDSGSPQWSDDDTPTEQSIHDALASKKIYVLKINNKIIGSAILTNDYEPAYENIKYGNWENLNKNYYSIHRFAIDPSKNGKGYAKLFFNLLTIIAKEEGASDIRVDTHPVNKAMQNVILSNGYGFRGVIHLPIKNGERYAYEKTL
ncbi:TPA: GNAT family N-acetyltransferase [Enterococcus faecalis]|uniref:GNAT family N-acetyltransferase n=1 Tax=Enterococcus faecalis TaxID=1351 RepID=UPI001923AA17|nr:GNAT family N-acetyltransferase [Enterococcus faecalis]EGO8500347.1 GNAT family N-acetyltransferase [Enterococcus faecalis]EIQ7100183.1 GNAT family N-acetyltransferase [Enterococcus faecalis]MDK7898398.1 GNAT family N-acetyltransferase [Enterococcus faecalis]HAP5856394.1 GNAT family N-acetyltransferase [Enterococcus faecalis]HAP5878360.1 GNAT family N-acetyltransferase [Enterococcus faecalis]